MARISLPVVAKLVARSRGVRDASDEGLRPGESPLSKNAVAGATIEVPIEATCAPTRVCAADCYAASGPQAVPHNLAKQYRVQRSIERDPEAFARLVVEHLDRGGHTHLRWNGVGDLTPAAVRAIDAVAALRPELPIWVVTRIPELAAQIAPAPRVFVHVSLDRESLARRDAFLAHGPRNSNYFFSYQCARDEVPPRGEDIGVSVVFHRRYRPAEGSALDDPALCPLNTLDDCAGACAACRRCFNGEAVAMRQGRPASAP